MSYSDPRYDVRSEPLAVYNTNVGTATATASGHVVTGTAVASLPKFIKRRKINAVRVRVETAAAATTAGTKLVFLNGTNTFAVATIGTVAAGTNVDATMTASNAIIAADVQPTVNAVGTGTASAAGVYGSYTIFWEQQELYVT